MSNGCPFSAGMVLEGAAQLVACAAACGVGGGGAAGVDAGGVVVDVVAVGVSCLGGGGVSRRRHHCSSVMPTFGAAEQTRTRSWLYSVRAIGRLPISLPPSSRFASRNRALAHPTRQQLPLWDQPRVRLQLPLWGAAGDAHDRGVCRREPRHVPEWWPATRSPTTVTTRPSSGGRTPLFFFFLLRCGPAGVKVTRNVASSVGHVDLARDL